MGMIRFFLSPNGRIGRARWWLGMIALIVISQVLQVWLLASLFDYNVFDVSAPPLAKPAHQILSIVSLALLYPLFAISAKRVHDRGRSAWWVLVIIVPFLLMIAASPLGYLDWTTPQAFWSSSQLGLGTLLLVLVGLLWAVVDLGILAGTPGDNEFGPDPHARAAAA